MNKQEALQKIEELQEYIEECDRRPDVKIGQLWEDGDGSVGIVTKTSKGLPCNDNFNLIMLNDGDEGNNWLKDKGFGSSPCDFTYIGMAKDLLTIRKT